MSFLIRKITRSKWKNIDDPEGKQDVLLEKVSSDAITSCLRTSANTLSFWTSSQVDDFSKEKENIKADELSDELKNIILALLTTKDADSIPVLDLIYIDKSDIDKANNIEVNFKNTDGDTVIESFKKLHINIEDISYSSLIGIANLVIQQVNSKKCIRIQKNELKKLLHEHSKQDPDFLNLITERLKKKINL